MSQLSLGERLRIRALSVEQSRRRAITRTLSSPFLRWRYGHAATDQILIVPQELRAADPSFWHEVAEGFFGLACQVAELKGASPFRIKPPSPAWAREVHGFGWLRHFAATEEDEAHEAARALVVDWITTQRKPAGIAYEPAVIARRVISWIAQANMLLEGTDAKTYARIMSSLNEQLVALNTTWRNSPDGVPRLTCLIAMVLSDLAVSGHDRQLKDAQAQLVAEIGRQILSDGGHVSRNPSVLADIVLDLLPLGQCFNARGPFPTGGICRRGQEGAGVSADSCASEMACWPASTVSASARRRRSRPCSGIRAANSMPCRKRKPRTMPASNRARRSWSRMSDHRRPSPLLPTPRRAACRSRSPSACTCYSPMAAIPDPPTTIGSPSRAPPPATTRSVSPNCRPRASFATTSSRRLPADCRSAVPISPSRARVRNWVPPSSPQATTAI